MYMNEYYLFHVHVKNVDMLNVHTLMFSVKLNMWIICLRLRTGNIMSDYGKDILFGQNGPIWKYHRQIVHQAMRSELDTKSN